MNEKPKSIWKKSWTGWRAFLLFSALMFAAFLAIGLIAGAEPKLPMVFAGIGTLVSLVIALGVVFFRWLFWTHWRRGLFTLACFATLIALFYAEEDWRGWHAWNQFKHEWEAKGEHFDFASIVPPPVPDEQNFAMAPIWVESMKAVLGPKNSREWFGDKYAENGRTNFVDRLDMPLARNYSDWPTNGVGSWQKATLTDLKPWQNYYRTLAAKTNLFPVAAQPQSPAQDVLLALSKYDSTIEELRQASQLPYSRFPLDYESQPPAAILLPHLAALKRCSQVIRLRAIAELQDNESQRALDDVKLSLRLIDSIRTEPFLISHLVRIAILQITLQPIYEGLAERKWSDAQLADLDSELAKLDFLSDYESAMRGERNLGIANIEFLRHPNTQNQILRRPRLHYIAPFFSLIQELSNLSGENDENFQMDFQTLALGFGPSGWLVQNELRIAQFDTKWYLPIVDHETQTISPAKAHAVGNALDREIRHQTPENLLERLFMPALGSTAVKFADAQSSTDLARVAIALERYRLAHGEFPESLDALAPQFIAKVPHDIIGGQPLKYRREADGQFVLYSIGWNEKDDGGVVAFTKGKTPSLDIANGDWVWRYPAK
jgi:hypothetical protein